MENLHTDFNFEEPFDFALENYGKESSHAILDCFGNQVIEEEDLTMSSFHYEDVPYVTAYTGHEMSYQELLAASDARSNSLTTAQSTPHAMPGRFMAALNLPAHKMSTPIMASPRWASPAMPTFNKAAPSMITGDMSNTKMAPAHMDATSMADPVMAPPSTVVPGTGNAQTTNTTTSVKKTCNLCIKRKVKCHIVEGSDPKVCELCKKKGADCVFEQRKEYPVGVTHQIVKGEAVAGTEG